MLFFTKLMNLTPCVVITQADDGAVAQAAYRLRVHIHERCDVVGGQILIKLRCRT